MTSFLQEPNGYNSYNRRKQTDFPGLSGILRRPLPRVRSNFPILSFCHVFMVIYLWSLTYLTWVVTEYLAE